MFQFEENRWSSSGSTNYFSDVSIRRDSGDQLIDEKHDNYRKNSSSTFTSGEDVSTSNTFVYRGQHVDLDLPQTPKSRLGIQEKTSSASLEDSAINLSEDVGQSILESYSRVIENLAFNLMTRIDDLQYVDNATRQRAAAESSPMFGESDSSSSLPTQKHISPSLPSIQHTSCSS